jgi:hypothetical protein
MKNLTTKEMNQGSMYPYGHHSTLNYIGAGYIISLHGWNIRVEGYSWNNHWGEKMASPMNMMALEL